MTRPPLEVADIVRAQAGMEDRKQADVGAQVFGIGGYLQKGLRTGLEQELIEGLLVLQYQLGKLMRQSKDNMDIGDRQKFIVASRDPAIARPILALGAVAIPAANGELTISCLELNRFAV